MKILFRYTTSTLVLNITLTKEQKKNHDSWSVYHLDLCRDCCKFQIIFIDISVTMGQRKVIIIYMNSYRLTLYISSVVYMLALRGPILKLYLIRYATKNLNS